MDMLRDLRMAVLLHGPDLLTTIRSYLGNLEKGDLNGKYMQMGV